MKNLLLIDGNSILNRAFYGIMNSKMLTTKDGTPTNAVYGFLAIMFKILEDVNPDYMAVAFDLKAKTKRHLLYADYKGTRKGMPDELAVQLPIIKEVLTAMNIEILEKEGYEADDILGTLAKFGVKEGLNVIVLTGDRDYFQLAEEHITIRIPRTKQGKTETEDFDRNKVLEVYGIEPLKLIEVKGLMGDSSDNIPGVPGVGEKTALTLIKDFGGLDNIYDYLEGKISLQEIVEANSAKNDADICVKKENAVEDEANNKNDITSDKNSDNVKGDSAAKSKSIDIKGKLREKLETNKELAFLSRTLGEIDINAEIEKDLDKLKNEEWNYNAVYEIFKELSFNRYIERFELLKHITNDGEIAADLLQEQEEILVEENTSEAHIQALIKSINVNKRMFFYVDLVKKDDEKLILKETISGAYLYNEEENKTYYIPSDVFKKEFKELLENKEVLKVGYKLRELYIVLKQEGIEIKNIMFDVSVASYILNSTQNKYNIEKLIEDNLNINLDIYENFKQEDSNENEQLDLFSMAAAMNGADGASSEVAVEDNKTKFKYVYGVFAYSIFKLYNVLTENLKETEQFDLFNNVEMPLTEVLAEMQLNGIYVDKNALQEFGVQMQTRIDELKKEIHDLAGVEFNISSTKQLGEVLFEKMELPVQRKTKSGYSTDVETLEKLKEHHPIIEKILEYRQLVKLKTTYVDGLIPYIHPVTNRIHSSFHQTVTATGRISSTDPNLQTIPIRLELGRQLRKVFKAGADKTFIDADYSQIELRVLAHISNDETMISAFNNNEDIHQQVASKVFGKPYDQVTKDERSSAKAVNFGIVYGISDYGLGEQLHISRKEAKVYIEQYLKKYKGIKQFMENIVKETREKGYVETLFKRKRTVEELKSKNFNIKHFGERIAMNTPIQGTAADIMKIAMINVYKKLKDENLDARIILQVHDEIMIETAAADKEKVKQIVKEEMENVTKLSVELMVDVQEGANWYDAK